jgi:hypothetical protein
MKRSDDRDKMIDFAAELTLSIIGPFAVAWFGWMSWSFMPVNQSRQITYQDAVGATGLVMAVMSFAPKFKP